MCFRTSSPRSSLTLGSLIQGVSSAAAKLASFIFANSDLTGAFYTRAVRTFGAVVRRAKEEEALSYWLNTIFYLLVELCKKEGRNYSQAFVVDPRSLVRLCLCV